MSDAIFALATAPGRGAIAVVRLSGPGVGDTLDRIGAADLQPRRVAVRRLIDGEGAALDEALCLWLPGPNSFTGEDGAELHLHGGRAVVEAVMDRLADLGLRPAEPGEFSRRAFQNGRMDLTQAEAIADLVDAESAAQRRQALGQLSGALSERYAGFRRRLLQALALLEAEIDFPDEETPAAVTDRVEPLLEQLAADLRAALGDAERGRRVREGYRIALIGDANAGKSSLFNALIGADRAIVTPVAGTTRDVLEAHLTIDGYAVVLIDTAGLRDTDDAIEAEGVRRARTQAETADLRLWVRAPDAPGDGLDRLLQAGDLTVRTKADLGGSGDGIAVSALGAPGLSELRIALSDRLRANMSGADFPAVTRLRHRSRLEAALVAVEAARVAVRRGPEEAAEDLRGAAARLAEVSGAVGVEDVLGEVFSTFCIGK